MSGLLAYLMQRGDAAKRNVKGLLADPVGVLDQWASQVGEDVTTPGQRQALAGGVVPRLGEDQEARERAMALALQLGPLLTVRTVGKDFSAELLHGTKTRNLKTLVGDVPADVGKRKPGNVLLDAIAPPIQNEFGAALLLSEKTSPQQALMFSSGRGESLAVVKLKPDTKVLDVASDMARAPAIGFGDEPRYVRFFKRPDFIDDMIAWQKKRISEGYKARNPNWETITAQSIDPSSKGFDVDYFRSLLVPYAKDKGYGAVRFKDEVLVTDRSFLDGARKATKKEVDEAVQSRARMTQKTLFTDKPE